MAYLGNGGLSGFAGIVGGAVGAYLGYTYAGAVDDITPVQGALILGGLGLVAGSLGAFILKSAIQFIIYLVLLLGVAYLFREQIESLTGVNPVDALNAALERFGLSLPGYDGDGNIKVGRDDG